MNDKIYSYNNFNINMNDDSFPMLVWGIAAGVLVAIVISIIIRSFTGGFVYRLKNVPAMDENEAKTLRELGFGFWGMLLAPIFIKDSSTLMRYVKIANLDEVTLSRKGFGKFWQKYIVRRSYLLRDAKFWLPEENRITAETRFSYEEHPIRTFVIAAVILVLGAVFVTYALPELLLMLDNFMGT